MQPESARLLSNLMVLPWEESSTVVVRARRLSGSFGVPAKHTSSVSPRVTLEETTRFPSRCRPLECVPECAPTRIVRRWSSHLLGQAWSRDVLS